MHEHDRLDENLKEKLKRWYHWHDKLDDFLKDVKDRLNKVEEEPKDKDDIKENVEEAKVSNGVALVNNSQGLLKKEM